MVVASIAVSVGRNVSPDSSVLAPNAKDAAASAVARMAQRAS